MNKKIEERSQGQISYMAGLFLGLGLKLSMTIEQAAATWKEATKVFLELKDALDSYTRRERVREYQGLWLI